MKCKTHLMIVRTILDHLFTRPNPRSSNKRKRSETYLMVELPVADWELWPEKESKLFVHHRLRPLLLRALDLLQRHVTKAHGKLTSGLNKIIKEIAKTGVKGWSPGGIPLSACYSRYRQSWGEMRWLVIVKDQDIPNLVFLVCECPARKREFACDSEIMWAVTTWKVKVKDQKPGKWKWKI